MKHFAQVVMLSLAASTLSSQNTINIQINHLSDGDEFTKEVSSQNNLGNDYLIDRLEYYLSGFSITHDGGQVTEIDDLYVLVSLLRGSFPTEITLGTLDINNLETISFHFGVDEAANHSDPSLYSMNHALAPKFPSMHWGWAAGYRFIALEGKSGPNVDQELQFHCIGDEFYTKIELPIDRDVQGEYTVTINADYAHLLSDIDVSGGVIIHGGTGEIPTLVSNISEKVFSVSTTTSTQDVEEKTSLEVFPNPITDGVMHINADLQPNQGYLTIYDQIGRVIYRDRYSSPTNVVMTSKGLYHVSLTDAHGNVLASKQIIAQ